LIVFVHLGDKRDRHGAKTGSFILELQQEISTELRKNYSKPVGWKVIAVFLKANTCVLVEV
jgi:hypothetical protein